MNATQPINIQALAEWSAAREVRTKFGAKMLSTAAPNDAFWLAWRANQTELRGAGVSMGKDRAGNWQLCWWQPLAAAVAQARTEAVEASRATDAVIDAPCPAGLAYLPYQRAGIAWAAARPSCLIADEMGLGKTIQAIGAINIDPTVKRVLVICPASLKLNWRNELRKWITRPMQIDIANGTFPAGSGIVIVNYDILKKHHDAIRASEWDMLVVDEAHLTKNPDAQRTQQVWGKKEKKAPYAWIITPIPARRRLALTGTPIVNRPIEAFPILNGLAPTAFPSFMGYAKRYCAAYQGRYGWDFTGSSNLNELQEKLRQTIMIRRLKKDVLTELPPKRRQVVEVAPEGAEAKRAIKAELEAWDNKETRIKELRAEVDRLKAEANNPEAYKAAVEALRAAVQVVFTEMAGHRHDTAVAKIPADIEHLKACFEAGVEKIVVGAHHHDVIDALAAEFGAASVTLTGDTKMEDRQAAVERFQTDPGCTLFIGNIQAAGMGLTLTAASHVVMVELPWTPGELSQFEDRCHRIGQSEMVLVQHLVLEGSLDSKMAKTIIAKQEVIDSALDTKHEPRQASAYAAPAPKPAVEMSARQAENAKEAETITPEQIEAVHQGLRMLAGVCDGAEQLDGAGFNKLDTDFGKELAGKPYLSPRQAACGKRLVNKYRRQLPAGILAAAGCGEKE